MNLDRFGDPEIPRFGDQWAGAYDLPEAISDPARGRQPCACCGEDANGTVHLCDDCEPFREEMSEGVILCHGIDHPDPCLTCEKWARESQPTPADLDTPDLGAGHETKGWAA